ncbi:MAG: hypothetical protein K6G17_01570 [Oscillospiraceae bacterium]|nr:hypothetical protein [Oscillospiraceae bacterium]
MYQSFFTQMNDGSGGKKKKPEEEPFQLRMAKEEYARRHPELSETESTELPSQTESPAEQPQEQSEDGSTARTQGYYGQTGFDYYGQKLAQAGGQINEILARLQEGLSPAQAGRLGSVSTAEQERLLELLAQLQGEQATAGVDEAVRQGVDQLSRAEEDAQAQFQALRSQVDADEATALDNQALYAEARGDRGGIGQAQYASIRNTAAVNRLTVNREQTRLATDTARQIADLRAQGEFQKADKLLNIAQSCLSELMRLKQWADETNLSVDEFNIGVQQWEQEYNAKIRQLLAETQLDAAKYLTGLVFGR